MSKELNIALVGNPNSGKTSLFNALTGLNQKVGNFPGVTVDKKTGKTLLASGSATIIDLPGTYSLYPRREDEWVAYRVLMMQDEFIKPDMVLLVADASNLKRNLLFCSQIIDLKIPVVVALTMMDLANAKGCKIDIDALQRELGVPVVVINPRKEKGIEALKKALNLASQDFSKIPPTDFVNMYAMAPAAVSSVKALLPGVNNYRAIHYLINHENFLLPDDVQEKIENIELENNFNHSKTQAEEILLRYGRIKQMMKHAVVEDDPLKKSLLTEKIDNVLLHRFWGYIILLFVLLLIFQSIFWIAQYPMDAIDWGISTFSGWLGSILPTNWATDLLINGIIAGLSGIIVFVPQIMILFCIITILEDTGYMARISFLTDKLMRKAGLNGKSVMPMISGFACAVPAIMSSRNIENKKERLLTILVTPLISCSARLPVYIILTSLVIPKKTFLGFISLQGLALTGLYLLGLILAFMVAWVAKWFIKTNERSFFILELPAYHSPRWKNAFTTMIEKAKIFVYQAGKVIMMISLVLWTLSSFGPSKKMQEVKNKYDTMLQSPTADAISIEKMRAAEKLQNSFAGMLGQSIEPIIKPLGFDWKIGISLITSFAAREVFVGTMATLYSVGSNEDDNTLKQKMSMAVREDGSKVYTLATGLSLLVFYVIAMQCMSTLAIVKRETKTWKWPIIQLVYMTILAYLFSMITYFIFK